VLTTNIYTSHVRIRKMEDQAPGSSAPSYPPSSDWVRRVYVCALAGRTNVRYIGRATRI